MRVRLYDPPLGRFLEVDPVEGGSCNDYDYVCSDPVNGYDLDGTMLPPDHRTLPQPKVKTAFPPPALCKNVVVKTTTNYLGYNGLIQSAAHRDAEGMVRNSATSIHSNVAAASASAVLKQSGFAAASRAVSQGSLVGSLAATALGAICMDPGRAMQVEPGPLRKSGPGPAASLGRQTWRV
ncbi:MAG: repeat-containing protein [Frankiales bacterium]|nr:repeat-containing protein [Frankiales bacterium]